MLHDRQRCHLGEDLDRLVWQLSLASEVDYHEGRTLEKWHEELKHVLAANHPHHDAESAVLVMTKNAERRRDANPGCHEHEVGEER